MTGTMMVSQVLWPLLILVSLSLLFNPTLLASLKKEVIGKISHVFLLSLIRFVMGMIVITMHNVRHGTTEIIVSVLWWLLMLGGAFWMLLPDAAKALVGKTYENKHAVYAFLGLALIAGIILSIHGWAITY